MDKVQKTSDSVYFLHVLWSKFFKNLIFLPAAHTQLSATFI
jgi:hypothetical protein